MEIASAVAAGPEPLGLEGANGLERLGTRFEKPEWVARARAAFERRLAAPKPLSAAEAAAFWERWRELDLDPRWRARCLQDGQAAPPPHRATAVAARELREQLRLVVAAGDPEGFLAIWGRAHAAYGHVWIDGAEDAVAFDGMSLERSEHGWRARDLLGRDRDVTLRRAGGHAEMRQIDADGELFLADELGHGAEHDH